MLGQSRGFSSQGDASMKALPKRKGNAQTRRGRKAIYDASMKFPIKL